MNSIDKYTLVRKLILDWYKENNREFPWRTTESPYKILVTEILLQKTIALNVSNIYNDFFSKYDDFSEICDTNIAVLQSDIKRLGLSNKRAKILKDISELIVEDYNGKIPEDSEILKSVNGIADYVSNAFACFGLNRRTLFYDVNIKRFIQRIFVLQDKKIKIETINTELDKLLPKIDFKYIYWAILDFASKVCSKNKPKCELCPFSENCLYFLNLSQLN